MQLGFVSAILPELSLQEVLKTGQEIGYSCVELMCWPVGKAERRYAGVTHIDVNQLSDTAIAQTKQLLADHGMKISGLGYYPNPLSAEENESATAVGHIYKVIDASAALGVGVMNTFVGRNPSLTIDKQWDRFLNKLLK